MAAERINAEQIIANDLAAANNVPAITIDDTPFVDSLIEALYPVTAWDLDTLRSLRRYFSLSVSDFKNEIALLKIYDAVLLVLKTG